MFTNNKLLLKTLAKATLKITLGGIFIGLLHQYDSVVAIVLAIKIGYELYNRSYKQQNYIFLIGCLLTGIAGIIGEHWGVTNKYWAYHDVSRNLPLWLPFAWMLAFYFLYKLELESFRLLKNKTLTNKLILTAIFVIFFPAFGEVITIALGVWTYYWPYQVFGVPLYAILGLLFVHMLINLILIYIGKKYVLEDEVFN